jgi:aerobic-type carbon monoxide dehydrogenase small subunit (CoxS/CutS family)
MSSASAPVVLRVNQRELRLEVAPHHTLLDVLRDTIHLTGTKECCDEGECGACTVLLNNRAVCSCLVLAVEAHGQDVTTIEGIATDGKLDRLQEAFVASGAVQCGFCIPGMIMAARQLLSANPEPTRAEVQEGLEGNLCRCGGYSRIIDAVLFAVERSR